MTTETATLYRQVAQALDAQGVEHGLLDECGCSFLMNNHAVHCAGRGSEHNRSLYQRGGYHKCCHGFGVVVPSDAECFYRLVLAYKGAQVWRKYLKPDSPWQTHGLGDEFGHPSYVEGTTPLDALLRAVAQSLGLEVAA